MMAIDVVATKKGCAWRTSHADGSFQLAIDPNALPDGRYRVRIEPAIDGGETVVRKGTVEADTRNGWTHFQTIPQTAACPFCRDVGNVADGEYDYELRLTRREPPRAVAWMLPDVSRARLGCAINGLDGSSLRPIAIRHIDSWWHVGNVEHDKFGVWPANESRIATRDAQGNVQLSRE